MKFALVIVCLLSLAVSACAAGNPWDDPYAGSPGSAYEVARNPPTVNGLVTYDPDAPFPKSSNSTITGQNGDEGGSAASMDAAPGAGVPPAR